MPRSFFLALALAFAVPAWAGSDDAALAAGIDQIFGAAISAETPGCAAAVFRAGEITFARGYGLANLEHHVPITSRTTFRIASLSKPFTALSALIAIRQGHFSLDDDIRRHLPEMPDYGKPITVRHLLWHTSGIRSSEALFRLADEGKQEHTPKETLQMIARQQGLNFAPGSEHAYSNSGYFLVGEIIERTTGKSLRRFVDEQIFEPLGMTSSLFFDDPSEIVPNLAQGYFIRDDGALGRVRTRAVWGGGGGMISSVEDLARFDGILNHNPLEGGDDLLAEFLSPGKLDDGSLIQANYDFGPKQNYGFGMSSGRFHGESFIQHGGLIEGYTSSWYHFPERQLGLVVLCNANSNVAILLLQQVAGLLIAPEAPPPPAPPPEPMQVSPEVLHRLQGVFTNDAAIFNPLDIRIVEGRLKLDAYEFLIDLDVVGEDRLRSAAEFPAELNIRFTGPPGRRTARVSGTMFVDEYEFEEVPRFNPSRQDLDELSGRYHSDELETSYEFFTVGGELYCRAGSGEPARAIWPARDLVRLSSIRRAILTRDESGGITGFGLSVQRARGVRFEKTD